jgi:hypothetical protein
MFPVAHLLSLDLMAESSSYRPLTTPVLLGLFDLVIISSSSSSLHPSFSYQQQL